MLEFTVQPDAAGTRLDIWLGRAAGSLSRARLQQLIRSGHARVDGRPVKPSHTLHAGARVTLEIPPPAPVTLQPQAIALAVLYEDADLIVVNKPAGLVTHPAPGHPDGTLVNALLHRCPDWPGIGGERRPGIVHRLDRDTTGALVAAKNAAAMAGLVAQFKARSVRKEYLALVWGRPRPEQGTIETLLGRSAGDRKKMSARPPRGRPAVTHYATLERFKETTLVRVRIETGRTHQIRVHLAHIGHPVVGDRQYGRARAAEWPAPVSRQMLHAERLALRHPRTGADMEWVAPLPADMAALLEALREAN